MIIAYLRKRGKQAYQHLLSDLEVVGFKADFVKVEVGSLGHSLSACNNDLLKALPTVFIYSILPSPLPVLFLKLERILTGRQTNSRLLECHSV